MKHKEEIKKAALTSGFGNYQKNHAGGVFNRLFVFDSTQNQNLKQCLKCGSDYMKFSAAGYCQRCQQRVEFILREHPQMLAKIGGANFNV